MRRLLLLSLLFHLLELPTVNAFPLPVSGRLSIPHALSIRVTINGRNDTFMALPTSYGPGFGDSMEGYIGHMQSDVYGCANVSGLPDGNSTSFEGNIALFRRGRCSYPTKILHAQHAGSIAVLIGDDGLGTPWTSRILENGNVPSTDESY